MQTVEITISDDGTVRFLVNELTAAFVSENSTVRRASHVEPDGAVLRVVFHFLRFLFGEQGRVSEFTRRWPVLWRVNLSPTGGPILAGRWRNRSEAIEAEVVYLNQNFI